MSSPHGGLDRRALYQRVEPESKATQLAERIVVPIALRTDVEREQLDDARIAGHAQQLGFDGSVSAQRIPQLDPGTVQPAALVDLDRDCQATADTAEEIYVGARGHLVTFLPRYPSCLLHWG